MCIMLLEFLEVRIYFRFINLLDHSETSSYFIQNHEF